METLDLKAAREAASQMAFEILTNAIEISKEGILDDFFIVEEHCWMFFRNKNIKLPETAWAYDNSYIIGVNGDKILGYNYFDEPGRAHDYAKEVSKRLKTGDI